MEAFNDIIHCHPDDFDVTKKLMNEAFDIWKGGYELLPREVYQIKIIRDPKCPTGKIFGVSSTVQLGQHLIVKMDISKLVALQEKKESN